MATQLQRRLFTVDDYHKMAKVGILSEGERLELIRGEIFTMHPTTRRLFSTKDLVKMIKNGIIREDELVELIQGEIIGIPPASRGHVQHLARVTEHLRALMDEASRPYSSDNVRMPMPLRIHDRLELRPDICVITPRVDFYPIEDQGKDELSLVVEIGDGSLEYQRLVRLPIYARLAVIEVWLVNPAEGAVEVHIFANPAEGTYRYVERLGRGNSIVIQNVPDITVEVDDILPYR